MLINLNTSSKNKYDTIFKIMDNSAINTKEFTIPILNLSILEAPKRWENTTLLPIQKPSVMEVIKVIIVNEEPTAAKAVPPRAFPTIRVSTTLYNCCNKFPIIKGMLNISMDFNSFPSVKLTVFKFFLPNYIILLIL